MIAFEILASLSECFISIYFFCKYFGFKYHKKSLAAAFITFGLLAADNIALSQYQGFEFLSILIFLILSLVFTILFLNGKAIEKIISCIGILISIALISMLILNATALIFRVDNIQTLHSEEDSFLRIIVLFFTKFLFFLITNLVIKLRNKTTYNLSWNEWIFVFAFFTISCFICILLWDLNREHKISNFDAYVAIIISLVVMNIMLYLLLYKLGKTNLKKTEFVTMQTKYNAYRSLFADIQSQHEEIKTLRHDLKHYSECSLALLQDKKYEKAEQYLEDFTTHVNKNVIPLVFTGSEVIDAVINSKLSICAKLGIKTECDIRANFSSINELDVSILISNLLDNAIEACKKSFHNNEIKILISNKKVYLNIVIQNKISESVLKTNPDLKTIKPDSLKHGYGLKSIMKIVKNNDGMIDFLEKNGYFIADVYLKTV
ncbi:MAG: GHKL domain-containing protein [Eubacterium sp.]|jgi:hypothetical protein|nr:GHKL domain-containing protein [Eubacterium sp.]